MPSDGLLCHPEAFSKGPDNLPKLFIYSHLCSQPW